MNKKQNYITKIDKDTLKVNDVDKLIETLDELRPTAKDMFEMLGYDIINKTSSDYSGDYIYFYNSKIDKRIEIMLKDKTVYVNEGGECKKQFNIVSITLDELTAINKQIEELRVVDNRIKQDS